MPSYEDVTDPIILDETGQDMAAAIRELKAVIQPTNVCIDLDVSLEVSGWSNSAPYVYNWMSNKVTTECAVKVNFLEDSQDTDQLYISYEKIVGGVQFEAETKPTSAIPVRIHIVNAEADSITNVTDEMVSTSVIPNASNVKQALTALKDADSALNSKMTNYVSEDGETLKILRNTNLNNAVASGRYYCIQCSNAPINTGGYLDVYTYFIASDDTYVRQVYRPYNSDYVYERKISGATWSEWTSLNSKIGKIHYTSGSVSRAVSTTYGNLYRSSVINVSINSLGISSIKNVHIDVVADGNNSIWCMISSISNTQISFIVLAGTAISTAVDITYYITVVEE